MLQLIYQVLLNTFTTWVQNSLVYCPKFEKKPYFIRLLFVDYIKLVYYNFYVIYNKWLKLNISY